MKNKLTLSVGIWKDYQIDGKKLRNKSWKINQINYEKPTPHTTIHTIFSLCK